MTYPLAGKVCAVCGRVLDYHEPFGYRHAYPELNPEDHPAVPVDPTEVPFVGRCDFCHVDNPTWVIPCDSFTYDVIPGHASNTDWAACSECRWLIVNGRWKDVMNRALAAHRRATGIKDVGPFVRESLRVLYFQLRQNMRGEPFPITPPSDPENGP